MSNEQERAAFEAWAKDNGYPSAREMDGSYVNWATKDAWHTWQAASAGKAELLEQLKEARDLLARILDNQPWGAIEDYLASMDAAIRKATESTKEQ